MDAARWTEQQYHRELPRFRLGRLCFSQPTAVLGCLMFDVRLNCAGYPRSGFLKRLGQSPSIPAVVERVRLNAGFGCLPCDGGLAWICDSGSQDSEWK